MEKISDDVKNSQRSHFSISKGVEMKISFLVSYALSQTIKNKKHGPVFTQNSTTNSFILSSL